MLRHYLTFGDILGAIVPLLAFLGGIFWQKRRWIKDNQKEIYEPIRNELKRNREKILNYSTDSSSSDFVNTKNIMRSRVLNDDLEERLSQIVEDYRLYLNTWTSINTETQEKISHYFYEANDKEDMVQVQERGEVKVTWNAFKPIKVWRKNPAFYLKSKEPTKRQEKKFGELKSKLPNLEPKEAEGLFEDLQAEILEIDGWKNIQDWREPILVNFDRTIDKFDNYYLKGVLGRIWYWIKFWQDFSLEKTDIPES